MDWDLLVLYKIYKISLFLMETGVFSPRFVTSSIESKTKNLNKKPKKLPKQVENTGVKMRRLQEALWC
jgi:hypothetical protein